MEGARRPQSVLRERAALSIARHKLSRGRRLGIPTDWCVGPAEGRPPGTQKRVRDHLGHCRDEAGRFPGHRQLRRKRKGPRRYGGGSCVWANRRSIAAHRGLEQRGFESRGGSGDRGRSSRRKWVPSTMEPLRHSSQTPRGGQNQRGPGGNRCPPPCPRRDRRLLSGIRPFPDGGDDAGPC